MSTPDESLIDQLINDAAAGDESALASLFEKYRDRLRRLVQLRMDARIRARVDASDVVQEAFVEAARRLPRYVEDDKVPFFLWLRVVTGDRLRHLHREHLGAEMRDANREALLPGAPNARGK